MSLVRTVGLAIDVAGVVSKIAERYDLDLPSKIVMFHYDDAADTLYVHFEYPSKSVDSEIVLRVSAFFAYKAVRETTALFL